MIRLLRRPFNTGHRFDSTAAYNLGHPRKEEKAPGGGPYEGETSVRQVDVVGAVIANGVGEILCAQRSPEMGHGGLWEFPGGKIEPGETPAESLRREIQEELGCEITVGEQVADVTYAYPELAIRLITYHARLMEGQPTPREHAELRWLPVTELDDLDWAPADVPTVQRLQQEEGAGHRSTGFSG